MESLKRYLLRNFEQVFVLTVLLSVAAITYLIPYKLAFLNIYYIPVLLAAYYLGTRTAMLGAVFSIIMVSAYAWIFPREFGADLTPLDLTANIMTWGAFLVLSAAVVGRLNLQLKEKVLAAARLDAELEDHKALLDKTTTELMEYTGDLERKVAERTQVLERSKRAVEEHKHRVEEALYSTMDASVVKLIIEKRLRTEKRRVSILFCDLKGFTRYSEERRPEAVITDLNRYLSLMEDTLLEYGGHIDKYMGDGIMVEFGAPEDHERHSLLAVTAGLKMQERLAAGGFPWQMRVGIATGEPIIGLIGHQRQSYTALGDTVNLASRIEELCVPGNVTIDEATYSDVKDFFTTNRRTALPDGEAESPDAEALERELAALESDPDDVERLQRVSRLFLKVNDPAQARQCLKRALDIAPDDNATKLAFADVALRLEQGSGMEIRGRKSRTQLYEVSAVEDPLLNRDKIPEALYRRYHETVAQVVEHPSDLLLPVECQDGSVGHSRVVGFLSYALADALGLPDQDKRDVLEAGYLCDIGKSIVPHRLLNRRGSLSKKEFEDVVKHSREGVRRLKQMGYRAQPLFDIVECHHEQYGGGGYPAGLTGEAIPLGARIVAVADSYNALTSWRPYRECWEHRAAFAELEKDTRRGKFDPDVIEALRQILGIPGGAVLQLRRA